MSENELATVAPELTEPPRRILDPPSADIALFDVQMFEQMQRVAQAMGQSSLCPAHLRKKNKTEFYSMTEIIGNCLRVVNQAYRWGFDPFAVADSSYVVGGKLAYEGKLVAAVINSRAGLKRNLQYEFSGQGDAMKVTVVGTLQGETAPRTVTLTVAKGKAQSKNYKDNPKASMWTTDPEQKLVYSGAIRWARRHKPEVVMGVLTDDDLDRMAHATTVDAAESLPVEPQPSRLDALVDEQRCGTCGAVYAPECDGAPARPTCGCLDASPADTREETNPREQMTDAEIDAEFKEMQAKAQASKQQPLIDKGAPSAQEV